MGVETALSLVDVLHGAQSPWAEQRADPGSPGPLAHPVKALAVLDVVAVAELLVREDVAVGMDDTLGEAGGAGGVVQLGRIIRERVDGVKVARDIRDARFIDHEKF